MIAKRLPSIAIGAALGLAALPAWPLEEVIVTAKRRPVELLDYAGSVTRIDADEIAAIRATHSSEVVNRSPGAMIQRGSGQESLTALRSPVLTGAGACGAVLVLEDGIPIRPVGSCNVNELFEVNVEQAAAIEVLRGPASVLYGSSAVHGIINVIPARPAELPPLGLALETGSDDYRRVKLAASSSGNAGFGIALHATDDGGWRDAAGFAEQKLNAMWSAPRAGGELALGLAATHLDQETAGFITGANAYRDPAIARSNPNPEAYRDAHSLRMNARLQTGAYDWRAYLRSSRMDFLQHFLLGQPIEDNGQDSAGFMFSALGRPVAGGELSFGADAEIAASSLWQFQDGPTTTGTPAQNAIRPAGRHYDYRVDSWLLAAYAEWRRPIGSRFALEAGARVEQLSYDYDNRMIDGNTDQAGVPCPGGCLYSRPADRSDDFTNFAPRAALVWRPRDALASYLSFARGFRAPEVTELYRLQRQQSVADLDSEQVDAFELGLRWHGPAGGFDVAAFTMEKEDVILRDSAGFNVSGGRTRHRGIEYELDWDFAEHWTVAGSGSYAEHQYRFTAAVEQGEQISSGNDIDTAPRQVHALRLRRGTDRFAAEAEWLHVGAYWMDAANTTRYPGHDLANLRLSWRPAAQWSVGLGVTNLFDEAYADRADLAFGTQRFFPGRGRAWFAELAWRMERSARP